MENKKTLAHKIDEINLQFNPFIEATIKSFAYLKLSNEKRRKK